MALLFDALKVGGVCAWAPKSAATPAGVIPYLPRRAIETRPRSNSERPTDEPTAIENRDYICKESRNASSHSVSFAPRIVVMAPPASGGQQAAKFLWPSMWPQR